MKFAFGLAVLASLAAGAPSNVALRAPTSLEVMIEMAGNSLVKATFTNNGQDNLRLLKTATILDSIPVKKADVLSGGKICSPPNNINRQQLTWTRRRAFGVWRHICSRRAPAP